MVRNRTEDARIDDIDWQRQRSSRRPDYDYRAASLEMRQAVQRTFTLGDKRVEGEFLVQHPTIEAVSEDGTEPRMVVTLWKYDGTDAKIAIDDDALVELHVRRDNESNPGRRPVSLGIGTVKLQEVARRGKVGSGETRYFVIFKRAQGGPGKQPIQITENHLVHPLNFNDWGPLSLEAPEE